MFIDVEYCVSNDFRCLYMDGCVFRFKVCDGKFDCLDVSDEMGCVLFIFKILVIIIVGDFFCFKYIFNYKNCIIFYVNGLLFGILFFVYF